MDSTPDRRSIGPIVSSVKLLHSMPIQPPIASSKTDATSSTARLLSRCPSMRSMQCVHRNKDTANRSGAGLKQAIVGAAMSQMGQQRSNEAIDFEAALTSTPGRSFLTNSPITAMRSRSTMPRVQPFGMFQRRDSRHRGASRKSRLAAILDVQSTE
jgi:hypothetical protein